VVVPDLPSEGRALDPDGRLRPDAKMYVSVGSSCNACEERDQRRRILQFNADGREGRIFARGIRNAVGMAFRPKPGALTTNNGRDWLGDDFPPDTLLLVKDGAHYGWPYCNGRQVPDPDLGDPSSARRPSPPRWRSRRQRAAGLAFYTGPCSRRVPGRPLRRAARLLEPFRPRGVQADPGPVGRRAAGRAAGLRDRMAPDRPGVGPPVECGDGKDDALYLSDDAPASSTASATRAASPARGDFGLAALHIPGMLVGLLKADQVSPDCSRALRE